MFLVSCSISVYCSTYTAKPTASISVQVQPTSLRLSIAYMLMISLCMYAIIYAIYHNY